MERTHRKKGRPAYPLAPFLTRLGAILSLFVALLLGDFLSGLLVFVLFSIVGFSWRRDLLPILPAVLSYQLIALSAGYWFYVIQGRFPGGGDTRLIGYAVALSAIAITCVLIGFRLGARSFRKWLSSSLNKKTKQYNLYRLLWLTSALSMAMLIYDIVPTKISFSASQIIANILSLRYVPYVVLLLAVFRQREGMRLAVFATFIVLLPELLTGFSRFKEILLFFAIAGLAEWRPWLSSAQQKKTNRKVAVIAAAGIILSVGALLIWTGGLKAAWREQIWSNSVEELSSVDRLRLFFDLTSDAVRQFEFADTVDDAAARFSSGTLYFSYALDRVPGDIPYEHGLLLSRAMQNLVPRVLFPEKPNLGGDSWLVKKYAGIDAAGDEDGASIGLGWPAEFYIDFGVAGVVSLAIVYGFVAAGCVSMLSYFARNREIFFGLMAAILSSSLMSIDGSFAKLLPGLLQKTIISSLVIVLVGRFFVQFVTYENSGSRIVPINSHH